MGRPVARSTAYAQDMALGFAHDPAFRRQEGFQNLGALIDPFPDDPLVRKAIRNSVTGALLAWDPVAQKEVWRAARPVAWNGGTLGVAGGLVFQGTVDGRFLALDAKTGAELWSYDNQAAMLAGPISYAVDGEHYVAVPAGYGTALYENYCLTCHGIAAITGGVLPDLRTSGRLHDAELWKRAVVGADLAARGMPRFERYVTAADAELIRAYVARQAAMLYDEEQAGRRSQ